MVQAHLPLAVCAEESASVTQQQIKTYFLKHVGGVFIHIISGEIGVNLLVLQYKVNQRGSNGIQMWKQPRQPVEANKSKRETSTPDHAPSDSRRAKAVE